MKTLTLKDGDSFLVRWGLQLEIDQCECFAANEFWATTRPNERLAREARDAMRSNLADMRRCHELRVKLSGPSRPRVARSR